MRTPLTTELNADDHHDPAGGRPIAPPVSQLMPSTQVSLYGTAPRVRWHHAAVLTTIGGELGDREFPATAAGYVALLSWVRRHGRLLRVGVEGTSSYGAGLTRHLQDEGRRR